MDSWHQTADCVSSISCKERHQHVGSFLICGEDPEVHPIVALNLTSSSHTSFLWLLTTLSPLYTLQTTIILTQNPSMVMICCKPPTVPLASSPTSSRTHIHKIYIPKNYLLLKKKNYLFERGERERLTFHLLLHASSSCNGQHWARPRPAIKNSTTWAIFHWLFQARIHKKLDQKWNNRTTGTPIRQ